VLALRALSQVCDLLVFLTEAMEGPNIRNQAKVAASDVVVAVNSLIAACNPCEAALEQRDPHYAPMRYLGCTVLRACLEGCGDDGVRTNVLSRVELELAIRFARTLTDEVSASVRRDLLIPCGCDGACNRCFARCHAFSRASLSRSLSLALAFLLSISVSF